jgi:hypothetical protein
MELADFISKMAAIMKANGKVIKCMVSGNSIMKTTK